jgi:hypothetical protein
MTRTTKVVEKIQQAYKQVGQPTSKIKDAAAFQEKLDSYVKLIIDQSFALSPESNKAGEDEIRNKLVSHTTERNSSALGERRSMLIQNYSSLEKQNNFYANIHKQESWADFWDKVRFITFRLATAIGIAAIVLTTAWLAQRWNIRLPLHSLNPASLAAPYAAYPTGSQYEDCQLSDAELSAPRKPVTAPVCDQNATSVKKDGAEPISPAETE